ncbi:hypothetical protein [Cuniculiplasma divulgatum]|nr:hypothetical protein [Cuniculiplasma divulgatum]
MSKGKMIPKAAKRVQSAFDKEGTPEAQAAKGRVMSVTAKGSKKK